MEGNLERIYFLAEVHPNPSEEPDELEIRFREAPLEISPSPCKILSVDFPPR